MVLEMRHLQLVKAITEKGSMTRAAWELQVTPSAVSQMLSSVEKQLGTSLFGRHRHRIFPTPAGQSIARLAETVLREVSRAEQELQGNSAKVHAVLRLTTQCYTVYHWLPSRLKLFQRRFPNVEIQIVPEAASNPVDSLLGERLDLALICKLARNRRIRYMPLFKDEMVFVVNPTHRLAGRTYVEAEDLARENLIVSPPKQQSTALNEILYPAGIMPAQVLEIPETEGILEMVKAGIGIAFMVKWAVRPQAIRGEIRLVRSGRKGYIRQWFAATLRHRDRPPYLVEFESLLARYPISASMPAGRETSQRRRVSSSVAAAR